MAFLMGFFCCCSTSVIIYVPSGQNLPASRTEGHAFWRAAGRKDKTANIEEKDAFAKGGEDGLESAAAAAAFTAVPTRHSKFLDFRRTCQAASLAAIRKELAKKKARKKDFTGEAKVPTLSAFVAALLDSTVMGHSKQTGRQTEESAKKHDEDAFTMRAIQRRWEQLWRKNWKHCYLKEKSTHGWK